MSKRSKIHVWTDADLDGAGSYLLLTWLLGVKVPYTISPSNQFRESFLEWSKHNNLDDFEHIFILDLDVSASMDIIDRPNVIIVDHHESHFPNKDKYTKAKAVVEVCDSTCKLLYKRFKGLLDTRVLTEEQKYFILLTNDYDSYKFEMKETKCLNTLFWNYQGDRVAKFAERFQSGFSYFTLEEQNICTFYEKRFARMCSELQTFTAEVPLKSKTYKFVAAFASEFLNDIAQHILEITKSDVALVVNTKTNKVSIRRTKECDFDVGKLAAKLGDGGGHSFSAGCMLTERVMEFSKLFKPS